MSSPLSLYNTGVRIRFEQVLYDFCENASEHVFIVSYPRSSYTPLEVSVHSSSVPFAWQQRCVGSKQRKAQNHMLESTLLNEAVSTTGITEIEDTARRFWAGRKK
jgi:hypothetical protein